MDNVNNVLDIMANVPKTFKILDKEYSVKKANLLELSVIRNKLIDELRMQWKKDIVEVASVIDSKERSKFIIEALKVQNVDDTIIQNSFASSFGIDTVLISGLKITKDELLKIYFELKDTGILVEIFKHILDIKDEDIKDEVKEEPKK